MINIPKIFKNQETEVVKLPLLPLRDVVVFPHVVAPLFVGRDKSIKALSSAVKSGKKVFLATQKKATVDKPTEQDINTVGVIGKVLQLVKLPDGTVKTLVEAIQRACIERYLANTEYFEVEVSTISDKVEDKDIVEVEALARSANASFNEYALLNTKISKELVAKISAIADYSEFSDTISSHFTFKIDDKQQLLETYDVAKRLSILIELINMEIEVFKMNQRIRGRIKDRIDQAQKNYYLNEQMRAIKQEMGTEDDPSDDLKELESKIREKQMPQKAKNKLEKEFKKLKFMTPMSAEATVVRNYIDLLISLPWFVNSKVQKNLIKAENILNEDHYGLEKPKERILECLAVQTLVEKMRGPILCLVGPPGVGKTSLARSVSRATGREYVRLSLGGIKDEAEIRGHRRTYVGAMPGKIIQSIKKSGVNNPVMCLDEIDKMGMDFRGDPSSALLEVLDPEQNHAFNDHYIDVDYDLSEVFFITTANTLPNIPLPLKDRMEVIHLSGYTEHEKFKIARLFLLPKQIEANGLSDKNISFSKNSIYTIIRRYTREAGVRNLEREISSVCRKVARQTVTNKTKKKYKITAGSITKMLGTPKFKYGQIDRESKVGLVIGLAWTQYGGELLDVEALTMPGSGKLSITGKLGDVMKESAKAAVSFVRSKARHLNIDNDFHKNLDIHIHIPEGAIPKDGPSAGISMCTSIISSLTKLPVFSDVAMTGEITLRGHILPVGGLKEKILAAHRGGMTKVIVPSENKKDMKEIPEAICKQLDIVFAEHIDEVLLNSLILSDGKPLLNTTNELKLDKK